MQQLVWKSIIFRPTHFIQKENTLRSWASTVKIGSTTKAEHSTFLFPPRVHKKKITISRETGQRLFMVFESSIKIKENLHQYWYPNWRAVCWLGLNLLGRSFDQSKGHWVLRQNENYCESPVHNLIWKCLASYYSYQGSLVYYTQPGPCWPSLIASNFSLHDSNMSFEANNPIPTLVQQRTLTAHACTKPVRATHLHWWVVKTPTDALSGWDTALLCMKPLPFECKYFFCLSFPFRLNGCRGEEQV